MLNQAIDTVTNHSWVPSSAWRRLDIRKKLDLLDDVPVMSATVLGLEMLLHEPCIDLRMASELILSDVGATIQVLRLVGTEYESAAEHPCRMGDCLASLDAGTWFAAISARTFPCDREHAATNSLWNHCRLVAQYAHLFAESLEGIVPEEAYLVGLLHEIRKIPGVLGWSNREALAAIEESLPLFVLAAIRSMNDTASPWKAILDAAHELAGVCTGFDPSPLHRCIPITLKG
jgi:HDOD domain